MTMLPVLPVIAGESLTSYLNRAARFHSNMDVYRFLSCIEFSQVASMAPTQENLERLEHLFGLPFAQLEKMTFRPLGERMRSICGEVVHSEFAHLNKVSYCPMCLLEDSRPDSDSQGQRVGRIAWRIEHVRCCEKHGIELVRRDQTHYSEKFQMMEVVAPSDAELIELSRNLSRLQASGLQKYVLNRLFGEKPALDTTWLNDQPVDLAARACEMLGVILTKGTHIDLRQVSGTEWSEAGDVGFDFAARGEAGIREALQLAFQRFEDANMRGGPQKVFGRLYQWVQFKKNSKPVGPIRDVMREFILDHFPVAKRTDLLGEQVLVQRVHTARTLARELGVDPFLINRIAISAGLIDGDPSKTCASKVFDAAEGAVLTERVRNSMTLKDLRDYLNCCRNTTSELLEHGVIPRLFSEGKHLSRSLRQVSQEDADNFISLLQRNGVEKTSPSEGYCDIATAAQKASWPVIDIVKGILSGSIKEIEICAPELRFRSVLVNPKEVAMSLSRGVFDGWIGADEAAGIIGMSRFHFFALQRAMKPDGQPCVRSRVIQNAKGTKVFLYCLEDVSAFHGDHISANELAKQRNVALKDLRRKLGKVGVHPLMPKYELGRVWYRREEAEAALIK